MKIKCDYCGNYINDTDEVCPNCNGVNSHLVRNANGIPRTIEELRIWCQRNNIPLQDARFFIGEDYRGARAFGIYQDQNTGNFIVYKNKSDGTRAVRYEGKDEAYAVNEIFQKLKEEILNQKQHLSQPNYQYSAPNNSSSYRRRSNSIKIPTYITIIIMILLVVFFAMKSSSAGPDRGYYAYRNQTYYYQPGDGWFLYNNGYWNSTNVDDSLSNNYDDYYESSYYSNSYDADDFSDSSYYDSNSGSYNNDDDSYDNDWDSGWDSGDSWDSGYSDWGSDW